MSKTVSEAAAAGDRGATLEALRDKLARSIDASSSGRDIAALTRQLREVMDEIESGRDAQQETLLADIQRRRAEKRRAAMVRRQAAQAGSE